MERAEARRLTPTGTSALTVFAVDGPGAELRLRKILTRLPGPERTRVALARGPEGAADQVVVAHLARNRFEISGHGGRGAERRLTRALEAGGLTVVPANLAAVSGLQHARTLLATRVLLWAERGAIDATVPAWRRIVDRLLHPRRFALIGPPNAGKSTLLNALVDRDRALTSPVRHTTRDVLWEELAMSGVPLLLADTAGLSPETHLPLHAAATQAATAAAERADVRVLILDSSEELTPAARAALRWRGPGDLTVLQKCDRVPARLLPGDGAEIPPTAISVSALSGRGLDSLRRALAARALGVDPSLLSSTEPPTSLPDLVHDAR